MSELKQKFDSKSRAHHCLSVLGNIFDDYNSGFLVPENTEMTPTYLRILQTMAIEGFELVKYLNAKEPCVATEKYMLGCGKILLRLSYLIHEGRKETTAETADYFRRFGK